jgi:hypothetical protein
MGNEMVMYRAGELRSEGYSPSEALSTAWDEFRGGEGDEDDDEELALVPAKRRHNPKAEKVIESDSAILLLGVAAAGAWLWWYYSKNKRWPWQSSAQPTTGQLMALRNRYQQNQVQRQRRTTGLTESANGYLWSSAPAGDPRATNIRPSGGYVTDVLPPSDDLPGGLHIIGT